MNERDLERQLQRFSGTLVSSDVYQNPTAAYNWIANQTSHVGLGLFFTLLAIVLAPALGHWPWLILPLLVYPFKELVDVLLTRGAPQKQFAIEKSELAIDVAADLSFVSCGVATALLLQHGWIGCLVAVVLIAVAIYVFLPKFLPVKRAFDKSGLPFFLRLARYQATFSARDVTAIKALIAAAVNKDVKGTHLVLSAPPDAGGGMELATALGSELTARKQRVRYMGWQKLLRTMARAEKPSQLHQAWEPTEVRALVVDDVVSPIELPSRPSMLAVSVWVAGAANEASALASALEQRWMQAGEQVHVIDVAQLNYQEASA